MCKFGLMCKNPHCKYVHPSLPQNANQFKWVSSSNKLVNAPGGGANAAATEKAENNSGATADPLPAAGSFTQEVSMATE